MEDWEKNFFNAMEEVAKEVEQFFLGVGEVIEEIANDVQNTIVRELDLYWQEFFEPLSDLYSEIEDIANDPDPFISYSHTVEPSPEVQPACIGCRHYHGQVYGGNLLVCGMHPYGWDDKSCPDWESN